jgi:hypothetical protein
MTDERFPTHKDWKGKFTFESEDADGVKKPVEFEEGPAKEMADAIAETFGGMGITGVVWVDNSDEDEEEAEGGRT